MAVSKLVFLGIGLDVLCIYIGQDKLAERCPTYFSHKMPELDFIFVLI